MTRVDSVTGRRRPSTWGWLVAGSASAIAIAAIVLGVWWLASGERVVTSYSVRGALNGVTLDLQGASADIVGGGDGRGVEVRRTDSSTWCSDSRGRCAATPAPDRRARRSARRSRSKSFGTVPEWNPGRRSLGIVSPWWPIITGRRTFERLAS